MKPSTYNLLGILASLTVAQSAAAQPVARMAVSEIKPLLVRAIEVGSAHGILTGAGADYLRQKFDATAPIEIDVRALHALGEPGCSRLEVKTRQKDVVEKSQRGDKELVYQVNYCRDGRFPGKR